MKFRVITEHRDNTLNRRFKPGQIVISATDMRLYNRHVRLVEDDAPVSENGMAIDQQPPGKLDDLTKRELIDIARKLGMSGVSQMSKDELLTALPQDLIDPSAL